MIWVLAIISALVAYLVGSIPFGFLIGKAKGIDVRDHGSGNIGATNVVRTVGKKEGIAAFILDFLKGLMAVWLVQTLLAPERGGTWSAPGPNYEAWFGVLAAVCVILGHNYTCWLGFKGGKGIATSAGALVGLIPFVLLGAVVVWGIVFFATRYVSLASLVAAVLLPVLELLKMALGRGEIAYLLVALVLCAMAFWRHRSNIQKLRRGEEHKWERKTKKDPAQEQPSANDSQ
jgi:glycerol-3-phosphate acyltransferase PlsY